MVRDPNVRRSRSLNLTHALAYTLIIVGVSLEALRLPVRPPAAAECPAAEVCAGCPPADGRLSLRCSVPLLQAIFLGLTLGGDYPAPKATLQAAGVYTEYWVRVCCSHSPWSLD